MNRNLLKNKVAWILLIILIVAALLRFISLGSLPEGINTDEALDGYEAYSLLQTGKDHRGNTWPFYFQGFSDRVDNRFSLYVYSIIPSVAVFGLNEFATRLPAALYGLLTVLIIYFFAKEIFKNKYVGLLSAFLLAISPWHVQLSRTGLEGVMVPFLLSLGLFLFIKGVSGRSQYLLLSAIPFGLSLYAYAIVTALLPPIILALAIIYRKELWQNKKVILLFLAILFLIISPFLYLQATHFSELQSRFRQVSLPGQFNWFAHVIITFITYITTFFLVKMSIVYLFEAILILTGLTICLFSLKKTNVQLVLALFVIMPLPLMLTDATVHQLRASFCLAVIPLLSGYGLYSIGHFIAQRRLFPARPGIIFGVVLIVLVYAISLVTLFDKYPKTIDNLVHSHNFKQVAQYIEENGVSVEKIFVTEKANQPYIFLLYYLQYDPRTFQHDEVVRTYASSGWQKVRSFDKFIFCNIDTCYNKDVPGLYFARQSDIPGVSPVEIIYGPNDYNFGPNDYISFKIIRN
jgi:4-amino-4-deoxy-L-arabinose transferase-like glycosyltransferase